MLKSKQTGQFLATNGNTRYKNVQYKSKRMGEHKKVFLLKIGLTELPEKFVVHHLDENTKNNNIDNLAIITITAHNRIHSHTPWNKGLKAGLSEKWDKALELSQENRFKTFLPKFKEAFELQTQDKTLREIALIQGISRRQVSDRIKRYKNYIKFNN